VIRITEEQLKLRHAATLAGRNQLEIRMTTIDAILIVSDEDLAAVVGGRANDGTNY
jgi:hypothetical protein